MRRADVERRLRIVARSKGVDVDFVEGGEHTKVRFDGVTVTVLPRHREINEVTARKIIRTAEDWKSS